MLIAHTWRVNAAGAQEDYKYKDLQTKSSVDFCLFLIKTLQHLDGVLLTAERTWLVSVGTLEELELECVTAQNIPGYQQHFHTTAQFKQRNILTQTHCFFSEISNINLLQSNTQQKKNASAVKVDK